MGITGLIPFLEKASSKLHLKDIRGSTVAIDTYCWLHRGVYGCAEQLVRGENTDHYIQYSLKYIHLLLSYDIKPILVFDGQHLPAKALTEKRRHESRKQSKQRAAELLRLGKIEEARSHMRRCINITHEMALRLIKECRKRNVDCIVAPYEADAQMAWLNKVNIADYIITEDSDLTLFGGRNIIFKLDLAGCGLLVQSDKLHLAMGCKESKYTFDKFRRMCILSGCDYLDSLPGIGLAKACKFMLMTEEDNMWRGLKKIPQYLNLKNLEVDDEYIEKFLQAEATFKHMFIYNPIKRKMERLHELVDVETDERYCVNAGSALPDDNQAFHLALGNINPFSFVQLDNWHPDKDFGLGQAPPKNIKRAKHKSIWQANINISAIKENRISQKKSIDCALYFKKVDFINKTIDEQISNTIREENAKPEEAEVFSMYKYNSNDTTEEPSSKRKRMSAFSSDFETPIKTESSPDRKTQSHNPFAKKPDSLTSKNSQTICENASLLKILSPTKINTQPSLHTRLFNVNKVDPFLTSKVPVLNFEVKSRFFSSNVQQVLNAQSTNQIDITQEIEEIESNSQKKQENQLILYNSPSPIKKEAIAVEDEDIDDKLGVLPLTPSDDSSQPLTNSGSTVSDVIVICDDDSIDGTYTTSSTKLEPGKLSTLKAVVRPRLGLSNRKKTTKLKSSPTNPGNQQTRLSMFGFKKLPVLK